MTEKILDLSDVISVSILGAPANLALPNINTAALFTKENKPEGWDEDQEHEVYTSASAVTEDFGSDSAPSKMAVAFFSQQPNPIGSGGYLLVVPRTQESGPVYEDVEDAIDRVKDFAYFFGVLVDEEFNGLEAKFLTLTAAVQAMDKVLFVASSNDADIAASGLFDDVRTASKTHTRCLFHSETPFEFAAAYAARALSTDFAGSLTVQTLHMKTLATISPDPVMDETTKTLAYNAGVECYVNIGGLPGLFTSGKNKFWDQVYNAFWLKFAIQTECFNFVRGTNTKIPQTEQGIDGLKNVVRRVLAQGVSNGYLAPGLWTSPDTFGDPESLVRNIADVGWYVYSTPLKAQIQADRDLRKAPLIQVAAKEAGAVHSANIQVNINS